MSSLIILEFCSVTIVGLLCLVYWLVLKVENKQRDYRYDRVNVVHCRSEQLIVIMFPFWNSVLCLVEVLVAFLCPLYWLLWSHPQLFSSSPSNYSWTLIFPLYFPSWDLQPPALVCPWSTSCLLFCSCTALCWVLNSPSSSFFIYSVILLEHIFKSLVEGKIVECLYIKNSAGTLDW